MKQKLSYWQQSNRKRRVTRAGTGSRDLLVLTVWSPIKTDLITIVYMQRTWCWSLGLLLQALWTHMCFDYSESHVLLVSSILSGSYNLSASSSSGFFELRREEFDGVLPFRISLYVMSNCGSDSIYSFSDGDWIRNWCLGLGYLSSVG